MAEADIGTLQQYRQVTLDDNPYIIDIINKKIIPKNDFTDRDKLEKLNIYREEIKERILPKDQNLSNVLEDIYKNNIGEDTTKKVRFKGKEGEVDINKLPTDLQNKYDKLIREAINRPVKKISTITEGGAAFNDNQHFYIQTDTGSILYQGTKPDMNDINIDANNLQDLIETVEKVRD